MCISIERKYVDCEQRHQSSDRVLCDGHQTKCYHGCENDCEHYKNACHKYRVELDSRKPCLVCNGNAPSEWEIFDTDQVYQCRSEEQVSNVVGDIRGKWAREMIAGRHFSAMELIKRVDTWPSKEDRSAYKEHTAKYWSLMVPGYPERLGHVHDDFVREMRWPDGWMRNEDERLLFLPEWDFQGLSHLMHNTLRDNYLNGRSVHHWSQETFTLRDDEGRDVLRMNRAGTDIFGVVDESVQMIVFMRTEAGIEYLVPRRARDMVMFPGLLDTFATGYTFDREESSLQAIADEVEKYGIPGWFIREQAREYGTVKYSMAKTNDGRNGCQHHCLEVFEMQIVRADAGMLSDEEGKEFQRMTVTEVKAALLRGEFAPHAIMSYVAHFVLHGIVHRGREPQFDEVCARLQREHDLSVVRSTETEILEGTEK